MRCMLKNMVRCLEFAVIGSRFDIAPLTVAPISTDYSANNGGSVE